VDSFLLAGKTYHSRLLVGTGRYPSPAIMQAAVEASGAEIITVALRRTDLSQAGEGSIQQLLPPATYTYLPNSAGCYTAEEAVRTLKLARELGGWNLVKLEVIGDKTSLYPDMDETLKAAEILVSGGFHVMAYATDDAAGCKRLEDAGCVAVMPLASPIGSGLGIMHPDRIANIVSQSTVPVLVDAGIGTASDAAIAMELGCAGVLLNTAIAQARDPVGMARAMKAAVEAGRMAFLAGRIPKRGEATASSPEVGTI
jgi:thiazole synthase